MTKKRNVDVLLHILVPKHILLTKSETEELLEKYKIRLTDLPRIFDKDPVAIAIGAKEGDVIKIIRDSDTTVSKVFYYRYVIKEKV
ncbi:MAG: DNA-directed RNA polymerase subunit H [Candidatus Lokiarchaeota archaeon]|nr:DNA-directed RNA polymerase subunit H [Candidatus Lokiarchaeota archaeon]